jgi:formylglycine-generating enzyme required for sulfatase activity
VANRSRKTDILMRLVPPGSFIAGQATSRREVQEDAGGELYEVTITKPFYAGVFEVTVAQWEKVMGTPPPAAAPVTMAPDAPALGVSWHDCQEFCRRLCQLEGVPEGTYRVLAEPEWEHACRAGTSTAYYTGSGPADLARAGWYSANSDGRAHSVGQLVPNAWGLYDLHGNAWEWCQGQLDEYPGIRAPRVAPPNGAVPRSVRGGTWSSEPEECCGSARAGRAPEARDGNVGFRLAREAPATTGAGP